MGYTALLFCPDEKTARTVTQVIGELEFTIEACNEPFAAVKKLMGQHFDALVVDCDHEQNATLLFKSARNSTANQTSLAVAVVEGQAGVAKAFRMGANLVLTKPINIEQAKGTLRVARGLLRKGDSPKAMGPTAPEAPSKTAAPKPSAEMASSRGSSAFAARPRPAVQSSMAQDDDLLGIDEDQSKSRPAAAAASASQVPAGNLRAPVEAKPVRTSLSQALAMSGAASAPAPAREIEKPAIAKEVSIPPKQSPLIAGPAPAFTFGGNVSDGSGGSAKKIIIGLVAALLLAAVGYASWSHLHSSTNQNSSPSSASSVTESTSEPSSPPVQPAPSKPGTQARPSAGTSRHEEENSPGESSFSRPASTKAELPSSEPEVEVAVAPETQPLVVKSGKAAAKHKQAVNDDTAPSMIGLASSGDGTPPPNFTTSEDTEPQPTLQTLNISQGVSQGLLVKKVSPVYPANAVRLRTEGTVELMATISKSGDITHIKILSGESQLSKAAEDAVKQWKYRPYLLNGEPVEIQTQVTVNFKLPR